MALTPYQAQLATHFGKPQVDPKTMMLMAQLLRQQNPPPTVMSQGMPPPAAPPLQPTAPAMSVPKPPPPVLAQGPNTVPQGIQGPPQGPPPGEPMSPNRDAPSPFDNMSPEMAQSLMSLGGKDRQMKYAEKLRDRDPLQGTKFRNSVGGETFVGSGPAAFALRAYENFRGKKDIAKLDKDQTQGRMDILDLLRGKRRDKAAEAQGSTPVGEGDGY